MANTMDGNASAMGHDPLAWITSEESEAESSVETTTTEVQEVAQEVVQEGIGKNTDAVVQDEEVEKVEKEPIHQAIALAEQAATGHVITLEGDVGIANVNILHGELKEALQQSLKITIQANDLSHIDTTGVQVLYAFVREAKQSEIEVQWQNLPESFLKTVAVLGLSEKMAVA